MFASPNKLIEVLTTVGNLKNDKAVGIHDVSAEVLKPSHLVKIFSLTEFLKVFFVTQLVSEVSEGCNSICFAEVGWHNEYQ